MVQNQVVGQHQIGLCFMWLLVICFSAQLKRKSLCVRCGSAWECRWDSEIFVTYSLLQIPRFGLWIRAKLNTKKQKTPTEDLSDPEHVGSGDANKTFRNNNIVKHTKQKNKVCNKILEINPASGSGLVLTWLAFSHFAGFSLPGERLKSQLPRQCSVFLRTISGQVRSSFGEIQATYSIYTILIYSKCQLQTQIYIQKHGRLYSGANRAVGLRFLPVGVQTYISASHFLIYLKQFNTYSLENLQSLS